MAHANIIQTIAVYMQVITLNPCMTMFRIHIQTVVKKTRHPSEVASEGNDYSNKDQVRRKTR